MSRLLKAVKNETPEHRYRRLLRLGRLGKRLRELNNYYTMLESAIAKNYRQLNLDRIEEETEKTEEEKKIIRGHFV